MLPFPQLLKYGNIIQEWYRGSLMAFDSSIFSGTGFTDYMGNTIAVQDMNGAVGTAKLSTGTGMQYGSGFEVNYSLIGIKDSDVNPAWITNSFTLDFWSRQKIAGYTYFAPMNCLNTFSGPWAANPKFQYINDNKFNAKFMIGTNAGYFQYTYIPWNITEWKHYCFMYDSTTSTHRFYINGVLTNTYTSITVQSGALKSLGIAGDVYRDSATNTAIMERYRLRSGMMFNTSGFDINEIY